jgi:hypothetical protein
MLKGTSSFEEMVKSTPRAGSVQNEPVHLTISENKVSKTTKVMSRGSGTNLKNFHRSKIK